MKSLLEMLWATLDPTIPTPPWIPAPPSNTIPSPPSRPKNKISLPIKPTYREKTYQTSLVVTDQGETKTISILVTERSKRKTATARWQGASLNITMPIHWPSSEKQRILKEITEQCLIFRRKQSKETRLLADYQGPKVTFTSQESLKRYVHALNTETFQVNLKNVRIGWAKHSHLAQMNIQSHVMTISKYCLKDVPECALRYLIIHELAHLIEANHTQRFWRLVAEHVPDYKFQIKLMRAHFHMATQLEAQSDVIA